MILIRRPLVIYDIDVVFALLSAASLVGAYMGVVIPAGQSAQARRTLWHELQSEQADIARLRNQIERDQTLTDQIARGIERSTATIAHLSQLNEAVNALVDDAARAGVEFTTIVPERPSQTGERWSSLVQLSGAAEPNDFLRFLDALTRRHPHDAVEQFVIDRPPDAAESKCSLSMTIRIYLLPDETDRLEVPTP